MKDFDGISYIAFFQLKEKCQVCFPIYLFKQKNYRELNDERNKMFNQKQVENSTKNNPSIYEKKSLSKCLIILIKK